MTYWECWWSCSYKLSANKNWSKSSRWYLHLPKIPPGRTNDLLLLEGRGKVTWICSVVVGYEKKTLSTGFTGQLVVKRNFVFVIGFPYLSNVPGIFFFIKKNKKWNTDKLSTTNIIATEKCTRIFFFFFLAPTTNPHLSLSKYYYCLVPL